jgi:hypothetical protein
MSCSTHAFVGQFLYLGAARTGSQSITHIFDHAGLFLPGLFKFVLDRYYFVLSFGSKIIELHVFTQHALPLCLAIACLFVFSYYLNLRQEQMRESEMDRVLLTSKDESI